MSWQQLLGALSDLVERDLVSGAERLLISDFFDLVEEHFPRIGPYSTLARCGDKRFRVERRLDTIQGEVVGTDVGKALGWRDLSGHRKIAMAWLGFASDSSAVCLRMYPADTLRDSHVRFTVTISSGCGSRTPIRRLAREAEFPLGLHGGGYAWLKTPLPVEKYCAYWVKEIGATRELSRPEWETYWAKLESAHIVEAAGKEAFDAEFTSQPAPEGSSSSRAYFAEYTWPLAEAQHSMRKGKLVGRRLRAARQPDANCTPAPHRYLVTAALRDPVGKSLKRAQCKSKRHPLERT